MITAVTINKSTKGKTNLLQ